MVAKPNIAIIGAGNLAWHLAPGLEKAGLVVSLVYSRTEEKALRLANRLYQAEITDSLDFSEASANVYFITVADSAINEISKEIVLPENAIIVHTSGSMPLSLLSYTATPNFGVFYPLQTFSYDKEIDFDGLPILIEAENKYTSQSLEKIGKTLSGNVKSISSPQRKTIHVAAVFACNFSNFMMTQAKNIMASDDLDFNLLHPLIIETVNKAMVLGPEKAQTGPAARNDLETLDKHLEYLNNNETLTSLYQLISQQILDRYSSDV